MKQLLLTEDQFRVLLATATDMYEINDGIIGDGPMGGPLGLKDWEVANANHKTLEDIIALMKRQ